MTRQLFIWTAFLALTAVTVDKSDKKIQTIFNSQTFYITNIQYGGYFPVKDSIVFHKQTDCITAKWTKVSPNNPSNKADTFYLTTVDIKKIQSLMQNKVPLLKKCQTNVLTVFNSADTVQFIDEGCKSKTIDKIIQVFVATNLYK